MYRELKPLVYITIIINISILLYVVAHFGVMFFGQQFVGWFMLMLYFITFTIVL